MNNDTQSRIALNLFYLRLSLGGFMLIWALEKFVIPVRASQTFKKFFFFEPGVMGSYAFGAVLTVFALLVVFGMYKRFSYGAMLIFHTITLAFTWHRIIDPWGLMPKGAWFTGKPGHLFLASVPVWVAMIVLYRLRDLDTHRAWDNRETAVAA